MISLGTELSSRVNGFLRHIIKLAGVLKDIIILCKLGDNYKNAVPIVFQK